MNEHGDGVLISAYLDGELGGEELARVKSHLAACLSCRLELESLRETKKHLACAPRRALPPELIFELEASFARPSRTRAAFAFLSRARFLAPAGVFAVLALTVGLWLGFKTEDPNQTVPLEPLMAAHERYSAESLVPQGSLVTANYTQLVASTAGEPQDQEPE